LFASATISNGFVITSIPGSSKPLPTAAFSALPVMEKHFEVWTNRTCRVGNLPTIHAAWQPDIGHQQVHTLRGLKDLQTSRSVFDADYLVACFLQHVRHQTSNVAKLLTCRVRLV
jgi:hypothetical protein